MAPLLVLFTSLLCVEFVRAETAVMHYGHFGGLRITCGRDELISMESERLGYSTNTDCDPAPPCSVPYTLARWYCRGMTTCEGMQVERRPLHKRTCGADFTNCLKVSYKCVKMSKLTDICSDVMYDDLDGHIASPSFPAMYPPDKNCTCVLSASNNEHVQLETSFFLLKSNTPCKDWVQVTSDDREVSTKCGYIPETKLYVGHEIRINFHSDEHDTEMGFWMRYSGTSQAPVNIRCGKYLHMDKPMVTKSKVIRTSVDITKMKTENGDTLTSVPMTKPTVKPTIVTIRPKDENPEETMKNGYPFRTTKYTATPTRLITPTEALSNTLNPSFETHVKEFFHFSKRTSKKPDEESLVTGIKGKVTSEPTLNSNSKGRESLIIDESFEEDEEFDLDDSVHPKFENTKMPVTKEQNNIDKHNSIATEDYQKEFKFTKTSGYLGDQEIARNQLIENEQGYSTKYQFVKNSGHNNLGKTQNTTKQTGKNEYIQNDLTGWSITPSPLVQYRTFSETKSPRESIWKSTKRKDKTVNRVTATKIPYHKVTLPSNTPNRYEDNRHFPQNMNNYANKDHDGSSREESVSEETIHAPIAGDTVYLKNELTDNAVMLNQNPDSDMEPDTNDFDDNIKWLPMATASATLATREQWHMALMTILNNIGTSKRPQNVEQKYVENNKIFDTDLLIPESIQDPLTGKLHALKDGNKDIKAHWLNQQERKVQSVMPYDAESFATGQFKTAREYISLIDEEDVSFRLITTTTTTTTTTPEPRSTRKPETFTIGGLLLKGKGDFYQTIGRNQKPILVTPPVSPDRTKKKTKSDQKNSIKSVTWATVGPPKELILNSGKKNNGRFDSLEKQKNEETDNVREETFTDNEKGGSSKIEHKTFGKVTRRKELHLTNSEINDKAFLREKGRTNGLHTKGATGRPPRKTAIVQSEASSSNKDIMWVLLVIAIIGGCVFLIMIILLLYKRKSRNNSCYGGWRSRSPLSSLSYPRTRLTGLGHSLSKSFVSSIPHRARLPGISPSTMRSANFNAINPSHRNNERSGLMAADSSSRSSTPLSRQSSPMSDRPLPTVPATFHSTNTLASNATMSTQTNIGTDMCTQTNCSNYVQTDLSLASNPNDSLRKAINKSRPSSETGSTYFGPVQPKEAGVQTYTLTALPRNPSFTDKHRSNNLDQGDLNHSNISSWVLAHMPRTPRAINRRGSGSSSDADMKRKTPKLKAKGFKLPMTSAANQPYPQHQIHPCKNQAQLLANYQRLQIHNPTPLLRNQSSPKTRNSPESRIPKKESPKLAPRPMYTQVVGKQQEKQSAIIREYINNMNDASTLSDRRSNCDNTLLSRGQSDLASPDVILPPPQYSHIHTCPSPDDNDLPLPPPPLPPRCEAPALPPRIPFYTSDSSRTSTPDQWAIDTWPRDQPSGKEASISSGQVTPDVSATGNRRKVKRIVPRQANIFNDKVQPELRQILAQRISGKEPVEV